MSIANVEWFIDKSVSKSMAESELSKIGMEIANLQAHMRSCQAVYDARVAHDPKWADATPSPEPKRVGRPKGSKTRKSKTVAEAQPEPGAEHAG
jgi:hypothetical protein